ncbi:MAG TPA: hypothetical protein VG204_20795, partial [Terriglobia bacterium]|nr:hypothetical protein [Terriglobia bacterium]
LEMVVSAPRQVLGRIQLAFDQRLVDDDLGGNITWLSGWPTLLGHLCRLTGKFFPFFGCGDPVQL